MAQALIYLLFSLYFNQDFNQYFSQYCTGGDAHCLTA